MKSYTLLGFDFGMKKMGVAVGQTLTQSATPLQPLKARQGVPHWPEVERLIKEWRPTAMIVGVPLLMNGSEQPITHAARAFIEDLKNHFNIPVYEMDERLSTADAKERMFNEGGYKALQKNSVDCVAAQLILMHWLKDNADHTFE